MILFYDTETDGLPNHRLPTDHPDQPRIVQLAAILTEDDGTERASLNLIVKHEDRPIPQQASAIHGITDEVADRCGVREVVAAAVFSDLQRRADLMVAHNIAFDRLVMTAMLVRTKRAILAVREHCTMEQAAPIVNLPPTDRMLAAGFNKPKAPRLEECYRHFFGEDLVGAHDALADVRACARVFFHLRDMKVAA